MTQLHKQFTVEQVKVLFASYEQGHLGRHEIENTLGINNTGSIQMHFPSTTIEQTNHAWGSKPKKKSTTNCSAIKN